MLLLIQYTFIFSSVLILVALGGCFAEHSGVINLGLEGIMVIGALGGALMMRYAPAGVSGFGMVLLVLMTAILSGLVYSALLAVACINFKADQTIVGTALNLLGTAAATVLVKAINTAANPNDVSSTVQYIEQKKAFIVNIGSFEFNWFMLIALLALAAAYITLYKTRFGLRLMACGEHPRPPTAWVSTFTKCAGPACSSPALLAVWAEYAIFWQAFPSGSLKTVLQASASSPWRS